jgi:uncharacterized protein YxjI
MPLSYPLQVKFPLLVLSPELHLEDASGRTILCFKQKIFTLREATTVFEDTAKTKPLYTLQADRVIGFGAKHMVRHMDGSLFATFENDGWGSIWRARYSVKDAQGNLIYKVHEENPWVSLVDMLASGLDEIPVVGWILGAAITYFVNPTYVMEDSFGKLRYRMRKQRSFFERRYTLEALEAVPAEWEEFSALALMRLVQLQRREG